jgi:hypothetical protein
VIGGDQHAVDGMEDDPLPRQVASLLVRLLLELTPAIASAANGDSQHTTKPSDTGRQSRVSRTLPRQWLKFHGLFPEIPVVLSHATADHISETHEMDLFSEQAATGSKSGATPESVAENSTSGSAAVGALELFTAALKALTSLVSDCDEAVREVRSCEEGLVGWAGTLLAWCAAWRCCWSVEGRTGKAAGALSPNETVCEVRTPSPMSHITV